MAEPAIQGDATGYVPGGGGELLTARFLVRNSGGDAEHNTGVLIAGGNVPIQWDTLAEWDDIGFPSDYHTTGGLFFADAGDYLITVSAEIAPDTAFTSGTMVLSIETGGSDVNSEETTALGAALNPQLSVTTVHRFVGGFFSSFEVHVKSPGADDGATVGKAALTITKLN